jgi:hypothetical protein
MPVEPFSAFAFPEETVDRASADWYDGQADARPHPPIRYRSEGPVNPTPVPDRECAYILPVACILALSSAVRRRASFPGDKVALLGVAGRPDDEPAEDARDARDEDDAEDEGVEEEGKEQQLRPAEKVAMLSFMEGSKLPENNVIDKFTHLLDEKALRSAELNRARLCVIFCAGFAIDPLVDYADGVVGTLVHRDPESLRKFLAFAAYISWGPVLDSVVSETRDKDPWLQRLARVHARAERQRAALARKEGSGAEQREDKPAEEEILEFNPLGFELQDPTWIGDEKVQRRIKAIQRQFDQPAKLAIMLYLFELLAANTSVLRESRMAISEVCNVLEHEGDWQVLVEKGGAACVQVIGNVKDIQQDAVSIVNQVRELIGNLMRNDSHVQID